MPLSSTAMSRLTYGLAEPNAAAEIANILNYPWNDSGNSVFTGTGNVTMAAGQKIQVVNKGTGAATTVTLPPNPANWEMAIVKDGKGDASTNNITVQAASGNIDGSASHVLNIPYQAAIYVYNGTQWNLVDTSTTQVTQNSTAPGAVIVFSSTGPIVAAGSTQGNAAALTNANNIVSGADGTKGVILPTPVQVGQEVAVVNTNGASALKVYADAGGTGGTINGGSGNASASLAASKGTTYVCTGLSPTAWWSLAN
jgi:hypothetical protein